MKNKQIMKLSESSLCMPMLEKDAKRILTFHNDMFKASENPDTIRI